MSTGTKVSTPDRPARFVESLVDLEAREQRGALAALRRSLQEPTGVAMSACPYVERFLPPEEDRRDGGFTERAYYLVGALFALHPEHAEGVSLGHAFRRINDTTVEGKKGADNQSVRSRFVALLDAHEDDVADHLRHAVSLARANKISIDWVRTLKQLLNWRSPDRWVQRRLASDFWGEAPASEASTPAVPSVPATPQPNESEMPR